MNQHFKRPEVLEGSTTKLKTPCGAMYVTVNEFEGKLCEVMLTLGRSGTCQNLLFRVTSLLLSVMLQSDIPREKIVKAISKQMEGNCGQGRIYFNGQEYHSCIDYVFKRITEELLNREEVKAEEEETDN